MPPKISPDAVADTHNIFLNRKRLADCKGHVWTEDGPRFKCKVCGGYAAPILKEMYEQGKAHGGAK